MAQRFVSLTLLELQCIDCSQVLAWASWEEYEVRFLFGGMVTVVVGLLAKVYEPVVAGLFLAFPAILPASLTLVAQKESTVAAGADSLGAAFGAIGLVIFGLVLWRVGPYLAGWIVVSVATLLWVLVSVAAWAVVERMRKAG
ncbi:MAG: hypothetical protein NVSMB52_06030 [Chloroflexota bacterium]